MVKKRLMISVTEREHTTILAALRLWQRDAAHIADGDGSIIAIAEEAGASLSNEEIDTLCERINFTSNRRRKQMAKKAKRLEGILIEVNGGVVTFVQFNGKPVAAYHLFDWDELLGDGDTHHAWEGLSSEEQEFIRDRYPNEYAAIQERLQEEADATEQS